MAKPPAEWQRWVRTHCTHAGLTESDADECVSETLLRYHHRRGAYPWDEPAPDVRLLRLLARNVAHEYQRACARRQRIERDYYALQHALMTRATSPEHQAVSNADAERFRNTLPTYLQRTLGLLEAGYTPAEIAQRLNIRVSTVYTYCRDLKARFIEYFGYDPRISGGCVVNYSGSAETSFLNAYEEVADDETTAEDTGHYGVGVSDCEPCGDAPHAGGVERVQRGGGGATPSPTMSSDGCGCSQLQMEVSPEKVKETLRAQNVQSEYLPTQYRSRCHCSEPRNRRSDPQTWCPPKHWIEPFCDDYAGKGPDFDRDGRTEEPNYKQQRNRTIVECHGNTYVECGRWYWTSTCCLESEAEPSCTDGVRGPGLIIECEKITFPGNRGVEGLEPLPGDVPEESPRPVPDPRVRR